MSGPRKGTPQRAPLPKKVRLEAVRLRDTGLAFGKVAEQCTRRFKINVSESVVRKWVKARDRGEAPPDVDASEAEAERDETSPPAEDVDDKPAVEGDTLAELRSLISAQRSSARKYEAVGNHTAAARALGAAGKAAETLARLESKRKSNAGDDDVVVSRAEYARIESELLDRVAKLAADLDRTGGLVCGECGRRIRIALAQAPAAVGKGTQER